MSEKNYTPVEAAKKVLEKCQEMYNSQKIEKAEAIDKCGEMKAEKKEKFKAELDKVEEKEVVQPQGVQEMHPKLKSFIEKRKAKKAAKMEKMMGIGEKAPVAPAAAPNTMDKPKASAKPMAPQAQSAAPVNAPKPALPKVGGQMSKSEKKK